MCVRACVCARAFPPELAQRLRRYIFSDDDYRFTPTKHLTPPPHHSSRPAPAHTDTETPLLPKKEFRARRRTAPTDVAHNRAILARPRRRAWARGTVQRHVENQFPFSLFAARFQPVPLKGRASAG